MSVKCIPEVKRGLKNVPSISLRIEYRFSPTLERVWWELLMYLSRILPLQGPRIGRTDISFERESCRLVWEWRDWESQAKQGPGPGSPANAKCPSERKMNIYSASTQS